MGILAPVNQQSRCYPNSLVSSLQAYADIAYDFQGDRSASHTILSHQRNSLVQAPSAWLVLVEEVSGEQEHVYLVGHCKLEDLLESLDRVSSSDGISLVVANVVVGGQ